MKYNVRLSDDVQKMLRVPEIDRSNLPIRADDSDMWGVIRDLDTNREQYHAPIANLLARKIRDKLAARLEDMLMKGPPEDNA